MPDPSTSHTPASSSPTASGKSPAPARSFPPLPIITSPLSPVEVANTLDAAARRGKLPGFHKGPQQTRRTPSPDIAFHITDFGTPCESVMDAYAQPRGSGCELSFSLRLKPLIPWLFTVVSILTVWPGIWLTDSMLTAYFPAYATLAVQTWMWYLPLTVPFVPLGTWQVVRKSRSTAHAEALDLINKIQKLTNPEPPAHPEPPR
ncbi:MAG TPA: hypothetical protein PKE29_14905 [Phycisphaerales bacterium]|nr:hypothetical protein [Phycisphaerales bacterium]